MRKVTMIHSKVILMHETILHSIVKDIAMFVMLVSLWSVGWLAGSLSLQIVAMIMALLALVVLAKAKSSETTMTIKELKQWIGKNYPD
jgi:hypothetical protein